MKKNEMQYVGNVVFILLFIIFVFGIGFLYGSNGTLTVADNNRFDTADQPQPQVPPQPPQPAQPAQPAPSPDVIAIRDTDALKGDGQFLIIEYSDLECPFCKRFHPVVQQLVDNGEATWVYRHLPLSFHQTAKEGALIAECVRIHKGNDAFWTYIDDVFDAVSAPNLSLYRSLAGQAGLSDAQIDQCLASGSEADKVVQQHQRDTQAVGINGTPGSLVVNQENGNVGRIPGALPFEDVQSILDSLR